eukprot:GHVU01065681.1.p2 GENE.GHVU01065681.1~~GHVU01065681.1.p2  ORF type:complete len:148 (-),score=41.78 GHVU01065681.1:61-504(-)
MKIQKTSVKMDMSSLTKLVSSGVEKIKEQASIYINRDTPLERQLKEATSNCNWGSPTTLYAEIARAAYDYNDYYVVMKHIWEALNDKPNKWRRLYKALCLLEFVIKLGPERVAEEVREGSYKLRLLSEFRVVEEGKERGGGVYCAET